MPQTAVRGTPTGAAEAASARFPAQESRDFEMLVVGDSRRRLGPALLIELALGRPIGRGLRRALHVFGMGSRHGRTGG